MHNRPEALANLLKLPAADEFSAEACVALATTAAKACNLEAFAELCKGLPQLQSASKDMSLALLLPLYDLAVDKGWWCKVSAGCLSAGWHVVSMSGCEL